MSADSLLLELKMRRAEYKRQLPQPFGKEIAKDWFDHVGDGEKILASTLYRRIEALGPTSLLTDLVEGHFHWGRFTRGSALATEQIKKNFGYTVLMAAEIGQPINWSVALDNPDPEDDLASLVVAFWEEAVPLDEMGISMALRVVLGEYQES